MGRTNEGMKGISAYIPHPGEQEDYNLRLYVNELRVRQVFVDKLVLEQFFGLKPPFDLLLCFFYVA